MKTTRKCLLCGKRATIILVKKKMPKGAHYFGTIPLPVGKGEYKQTGKFKIGKHSYPVVKWTGAEKIVEYWECNKCYSRS